ncbi:MAG: selenium metabolism-associated LysR family transcriptional regulator [Desulfobulbaceae bacterium]|nr:selenium metabolism-associated LysR family transcriptional regulator [Desulfobulbaceae bacterium]
MEIRKLEVFCKVVELKSFTRAAEAVLLSQPTVSEHVRSLEEELGQKLIDRLGREAEPTPVGSMLYKYAVRMLRLQQEAIESVENYGGQLVGRIMIGSGTIPGTYILPRIIGQFRKKYSSIHATLRIAGSQLIASEVLNGKLDMAVVGAKWKEKGLEWQKIFSDRLVLVVNAEHPWAARNQVSLEELKNEPFILRESESGTRKVIDQILENYGIDPAGLQEVAEIGSTEAIKEAVKAGIGISILSVRSVEQDVKYGVLKIIPLEGIRFERPFYLIKRMNRELSPVSAVFWEYMLQEDRAARTDRRA